MQFSCTLLDCTFLNLHWTSGLSHAVQPFALHCTAVLFTLLFSFSCLFSVEFLIKRPYPGKKGLGGDGGGGKKCRNLVPRFPISATLELHGTTLHWTGMDSTALHCTALHCTALHCTTLHCTVLHCKAYHCFVLCSVLQCDSVYKQCSKM